MVSWCLLQVLWLADNRISSIAGLDHLTALSKLNLAIMMSGQQANHVEQQTAVQGMMTLSLLQVLWLADNRISSTTGLAHLTALSELNLASNQIEVVNDTLESNSALQSLNLANNCLGSFKQVQLNMA